MFEIVKSEWLCPDVKRFVIMAPAVAKRQRPGQFVIVRLNETGERIPLTIADKNVDSGTITMCVQGIGKSTKMFNELNAGDIIEDLLGPLGKPTQIEDVGTVVCLAGGVGIAEIYPIAKAFKEAGNEVKAILGGRTRELIIMEEEIRSVSDVTIITTDDGSFGIKGLVIDPLKDMLESGKFVGHIAAVGPVRMMQAVADITRPYGISTSVSLNPIMVDGTGMCGACRVSVDHKTLFACVDGPDFDAHKVDFEELSLRLTQYMKKEQESLEKWEEMHIEEKSGETMVRS